MGIVYRCYAVIIGVFQFTYLYQYQYLMMMMMMVYLGDYNLTSVVLPTSLLVISNSAFLNCIALQTITIPT